MRITQCHVSKSIMDFPFHEVYHLNDYMDSNLPCVFFGMYRYEDYQLMYRHTGPFKIFWTGQDALDFDFAAKYHFNNVTAHPKIHELITSKGFRCELVKPAAFLNKVNPQQLGPKIYAYCPSSAPDYHGKKILDEIKAMGYQIVIGDGSFSQFEWSRGVANMHYHDIFIGLCLSSFAGGGGSIIEMGLRGIPVITNVFDLPNCIPWTDVEDVVENIELLKQEIGNVDHATANLVWQSLDHEYKWLEI